MVMFFADMADKASKKLQASHNAHFCEKGTFAVGFLWRCWLPNGEYSKHFKTRAEACKFFRSYLGGGRLNVSDFRIQRIECILDVDGNFVEEVGLSHRLAWENNRLKSAIAMIASADKDINKKLVNDEK